MKYLLVYEGKIYVQEDTLKIAIALLIGATVLTNEHGDRIFTTKESQLHTPFKVPGGVNWVYSNGYTEAEVWEHAVKRFIKRLPGYGWTLYKRQDQDI